MGKITFGKKDFEHSRNQVTKEDMKKKVLGELNEWQLCPKCNGFGGWHRGSNIKELQPVECDLCNGKKIISKVTGEPPK